MACRRWIFHLPTLNKLATINIISRIVFYMVDQIWRNYDVSEFLEHNFLDSKNSSGHRLVLSIRSIMTQFIYITWKTQIWALNRISSTTAPGT